MEIIQQHFSIYLTHFQELVEQSAANLHIWLQNHWFPVIIFPWTQPIIISHIYIWVLYLYIYRERGNIHINWYIYIYNYYYYYCYDYYYYIYIIFIYYVYYICPHASPSVVSSHSEALLVRGAEVKAPHEDTAAAGLPRSDGSTRRSGLTAAFLDENSCLIVINIEILYWIIL